MSDSILVTLSNSWKRWLKPEDKPFDTLAAFVLDVEHELLSVITALQAHIDLLHDELVREHMPVDRFAILNRAIGRLIQDAKVLASVSDLAQAPQSKQKQMLEGLMKEIAAETRSAFNTSQVSLSCKIATGTTVTGDVRPLKAMLTGLVLTALYNCHKRETVRIQGRNYKNRVTLTLDSGPEAEANDGVFEPWQLGELRKIPMNGEGMSLSAVNAMARLHDAELGVSTLSDERQGYRLIFKV